MNLLEFIYITVLLAWTSTGMTEDSKGIKPFLNEAECIEEVKSFAFKHNIPEEPCVKMKREVYLKYIYPTKNIYFHKGEQGPIIGGHICKKNRKGKLYNCKTLKDHRK